MKTKGLLLLFLACCCVSCECFQHVQGVVIDSVTRLPIDHVTVKNTRIKNSDIYGTLHTDSLGHFDISPKAIGLFGCPKVSLSFEKEGYKKVIIKYKSCCTDDTEVVLEKEE